MDRIEAKREHKVGLAHVGAAYEYCVEHNDAELAKVFYRDLMQRAHDFSRAFNLSLTEGEQRLRKAG